MALFPQPNTGTPRAAPFAIKQVALTYAISSDDVGLNIRYTAAGAAAVIQKINTLANPQAFSVMVSATQGMGNVTLPAPAGDQFRDFGVLSASIVVEPGKPVLLSPVDTSSSGIWDVLRISEITGGGALFEADTFRSQGPSESVTGFQIADGTDLGALFIHGVTVSGALSGGGVSGTVNVGLDPIHAGIITIGNTGSLFADTYGRVNAATLGLAVLHGGFAGAPASMTVDVYGRVTSVAAACVCACVCDCNCNCDGT